MTARESLFTDQRVSRQAGELTVLFADICGSTRLYCSLGDVAARAIVMASLDIIIGVLPTYGGRVVKTLGDEVMCVFSDPNQAVLAAAQMQARLAGARPGGKEVAIHIGLHHGPVLVEGPDVFGDTVNAASYLCAVATAGQVLAAEASVVRLSAGVKAKTRPLFFAIVKGSNVESTVYQVMWQTDTGQLTDINLRRHNLMPPDAGSLILGLGETELRIDPRRPAVTLGRDSSCDFSITDSFASRRHATVSLRRTQIFLSDQSTNGTFVRRSNGEVAHLFRSELLLDGDGEISLGRAFDQAPECLIRFRRDRRALFRA